MKEKFQNSKNLATKLWDMANIFRGTIDHSKFKDYILVLLFIYAISYINEKSRQKIGFLPETTHFTLRRDLFNFLYDKSNESNFSELLDNEIKRIQKDNPHLGDIFTGVSFNDNILGNVKDRNELLRRLFLEFQTINLDEDIDYLGEAYQILIEKFAGASGKSGGEFFTPPCISRLLAKIADPQDGNSVYDPTCGSGSLLLKVQNHNPLVHLYGQEKNRQTYNLCKMNLILNKDYNDIENIKWGNTIINPNHCGEYGEYQKFDIIVANPPYSATLNGDFEKIKKDERFTKYGVPNKSKIDYLFLEHMIASLKDNGKIVTLMPLGVLERVGAEYNIRKNIVEGNLLESIITLPPNLFYGTPISVCIYIIKKNKDNEETLFIDASKEFIKKGNKNILTESNTTKIIQTYMNKEIIQHFSNKASLQEIKDNDYSLSPKKYIEQKTEKIEFDLSRCTKEIESHEEVIKELENNILTNIKDLKKIYE